MDLEEAITVTKLNIQDGCCCYLMIGWQSDSFEMYLYAKEKLWKGRFSSNRLAGFSRNLHMTEKEYSTSLRKCLSQQRDNYSYELKSGFFYWKRKFKDSDIIEGFLPMEVDKSFRNAQADLIEILVGLNGHLRAKVNDMKYKFEAIKTEYHKCLKDTEEFLNLKIEMEKALCDKFLNLLGIKKSKVEALDRSDSTEFNVKEIMNHNHFKI